jgi:hypothetical protein
MGSRSHGAGKWKENSSSGAVSELRTHQSEWRKVKKISAAKNQIWLFCMPDPSLPRRTLLAGACPAIKGSESVPTVKAYLYLLDGLINVERCT